MALSDEQIARIRARLVGQEDTPQAPESTNNKRRLQTAKEIFENGSESYYEDTGAPEDILEIIRQTRKEAKIRAGQLEQENPEQEELPPHLKRVRERLLTSQSLQEKQDVVEEMEVAKDEARGFFEQTASVPADQSRRAIPMMDPENPDVPNLEYIDQVSPDFSASESKAKRLAADFVVPRASELAPMIASVTEHFGVSEEEVRKNLFDWIDKPLAAAENYWYRGTKDYITDTYKSLRASPEVEDWLVTKKAARLALRPKKAVPEYSDTGELLNVRMETEEEALENSQREFEEIARAAHADELSGAAKITAGILGAATDPIGIMTGRMGIGRPFFQKLVGMSAGAGTYAASNAALNQIRDEGGITDAMEVVLEGGKGAAIGGALGFAFGVGGKIVAKYGKKRANAKVDELEVRTINYRQDGLNPGEAFHRAMRDMKLTDPKKEALFARAGREVGETSVEIGAKAAKPKTLLKPVSFGNKTVFDEDGLTRRVIDTTDDLLGVLSTQLKNKSPATLARMRRAESNAGTRMANWEDAAGGFMKAASKLKGKPAKEFSALWQRQDIDGMINFAIRSKNNDLKAGIQRLRPLLDEAHATQVGAGLKVARVSNFLPRAMTDHNKFRKSLGGPELNALTRMEEKVIQRKMRDGLMPALTDDEQQQLINNLIRNKSVVGVGQRAEQHRTIGNDMPEEWIKFYDRPEKALAKYLENTNRALYEAELLGANTANRTKDMTGSGPLAEFIQQQVKRGELTKREAAEVTSLIQSRIRGGQVSPGKYVTAYKNLFYSGTIGNPLSAITQFGDLAVTMASQGMVNTMKAVIPGLGDKVHPRMIGINGIAQELATTGGTSNFLNRMFRMTGFRAIDTFGKRTALSAALNKSVSQSKTIKGKAAWLKENGWMFRSEQEAIDTLADISAGRMTENVKFLLYNKLSDIQPISLLEVPRKYLENPNGRIFYALKTFMLKQFDIQRRMGFQEIKKGNFAKGAGFLAKYYGLMALGGATTSQIQNLMLGREEDFTDSMAANLMKNFALSQYQVKDLQKGRVMEFLANNVVGGATAIPSAVTQDVADIIADLAGNGSAIEDMPFRRTARFIPGAGPFISFWFGGGAERWAKNQEKDK